MIIAVLDTTTTIIYNPVPFGEARRITSLAVAVASFASLPFNEREVRGLLLLAQHRKEERGHHHYCPLCRLNQPIPRSIKQRAAINNCEQRALAAAAAAKAARVSAFCIKIQITPLKANTHTTSQSVSQPNTNKH